MIAPFVNFTIAGAIWLVCEELIRSFVSQF
jgi:hypothetical protein